MQATIMLRVGVRLVARVDDRARRGRGARDVLADVLGALREAIVEAPRCLEHLARAREDLASHEEGDERLGQALKWPVAAHELVLLATVALAPPVRLL